jgi:hypothetical protein
LLTMAPISRMKTLWGICGLFIDVSLLFRTM